MVPRVYRRYVAIGDSTTEGMDDPDGAGGYRGWADRFAEHVARAQTPAAQAAHAASGEAERAVLGDAGRAAAGDAEPAALGDAERRAGAAERTARVGAERLAGVGAERSARVEAERGAGAQGGLEYANLAIRGRTTARIRAEQLAPALDLAPDLATVVAGMNDILRGSFDLTAVARDIFEMQHALVAQGATVLTFTLPDPAPVMPIARPLRGRVLALNEAIRKTTADSGAILLDLGAYAVASDPRLWSDDRLHANSAGHERIGAAGVHPRPPRLRRLLDGRAPADTVAPPARDHRRRTGLDTPPPAPVGGPPPARPLVGRQPGVQAGHPVAGRPDRPLTRATTRPLCVRPRS
ncbi:SGNH/GDSL hydrolase family protein [Dactylosporangium darangshiense]|uniref:SGNH/GDSL hydrolase family protein n=1 Tax=Dactylosporangium darangshiense TaxID=579108 RepID=UPI0036427522